MIEQFKNSEAEHVVSEEKKRRKSNQREEGFQPTVETTAGTRTFETSTGGDCVAAAGAKPLLMIWGAGQSQNSNLQRVGGYVLTCTVEGCG